MALAVRVQPLRRRLVTQRARVLFGACAALLCGLAMTAATLYIARHSYGSLLGAMDPNNPDPWKIIRAYMVIELFILPALVCGVLFQLLPWSRRVMQRALGQA
jgi:fatty acid desaturase